MVFPANMPPRPGTDPGPKRRGMRRLGAESAPGQHGLSVGVYTVCVNIDVHYKYSNAYLQAELTLEVLLQNR